MRLGPSIVKALSGSPGRETFALTRAKSVGTSLVPIWTTTSPCLLSFALERHFFRCRKKVLSLYGGFGAKLVRKRTSWKTDLQKIHKFCNFLQIEFIKIVQDAKQILSFYFIYLFFNQPVLYTKHTPLKRFLFPLSVWSRCPFPVKFVNFTAFYPCNLIGLMV